MIEPRSIIKWFLGAAVFVTFFVPHSWVFADAAKVQIQFVEFFPAKDLKEGAAFEIVFVLTNTGGEPINPYAEVTLYGSVLNQKNEQVFKLVDAKYRVYNLWPGDHSARERFYIGALPKGDYKLNVHASAFDRGKNRVISEDVFEMPFTVQPL